MAEGVADVAGQWHPHEFEPLRATPLACLRCGRVRDFSWHTNREEPESMRAEETHDGA